MEIMVPSMVVPVKIISGITKMRRKKYEHIWQNAEYKGNYKADRVYRKKPRRG
jgi:hypothetical protein